ncbi:MAG TPA: hypothetical protein VMN60_08485 [Longimicrobiales bacterium]|nr:hypothetical protein [Longimicrobiales bacterium]
MRVFRLLLTALVLTACSDSTGPEATVVGSYSLRTINEQAPPVTIYQDSQGRVEITGGSVNLNADGTFTDRTDIRIVSGTTSLADTEIASGTYVHSGGTVQLRTSDGDVYSMSFSGGNTLTQTIEGFVVVYRK